MSDTPKVYVGTYEKYNNGSIAGAWIDLSEMADIDEYRATVKELHKDEADPEYMIQDYENFPENMYSETMGSEAIEQIIEWAHMDEDEQTLVAEYMDAVGGSMADAVANAGDAYQMTLEGSAWSREKEYGEYIIYDAGIMEVPEEIRSYIDLEQVGREYLMDMSVSDNGYVFSNN